MPIQNMVLSPTSTSYLRMKSSLPASSIRKRARLAGTVRRAAPSRTESGMMCGHQKAPARVDVEGPAVYPVRVHMLDQARLAGRRVDRIHGEGVFAAGEDALTRGFHRARSAINGVDEA